MKARRINELPLILVISFFGQAAIGAVNLGLIFFVKQKFALSAFEIGMLTSLCPVSYFFGLLFLKGIVSSIRPLITVSIAALGMGSSGLLIIGASEPVQVFLLYTLFGVFMALFWPPVMGWLSRGKEGRALGRQVAAFNFTWSMGIILGPYIAGILSEREPALAILVSSLAFLLVVILAAAALLFTPLKSINSGGRNRGGGPGRDTSTPLRFICWIAIVSGYLVYGITMNVFPVFARDVLLLSESRIGFLLFIRGFVTTLFFLLLGKYPFWHCRLRYIILFQGILILSLAAGLLAGDSGSYLLFFILFGIAFAGIYTTSIFHGVAGSVNREYRMALHEAFLTIGVILGSFVGGYIYEHISFSGLLAISIAALSISIIAQLAINPILSRLSQP